MMNPSSQTNGLSPLSPASLLVSLKARSITALKTRIINFSEELSTHFESSAANPKKMEADYDLVLETTPPEKQAAEGSSGLSIVPGTQKAVFNEIRRGILIRRHRRVNSLFSGEPSQVSIPLDNPVLHGENSGSDEDKLAHNCFVMRSSQEQIEIAKFHSGLESYLEQRKNKKVTFAVEESNEASIKVIPRTLLKVNRINNQRYASNERGLSAGFRSSGERLNSDNYKSGVRVMTGSSTLAQRHEDMFSTRPREIKHISRESHLVHGDNRGNSAIITEKTNETANSRESTPNIKSTESPNKRGLLTKFPFISSPPTKVSQRNSLPSSPEKSSKGSPIKKEGSLFEKESPIKSRGSTPSTPYMKELLEGRKALDNHGYNSDTRRKAEGGSMKLEKKARQSYHQSSLMARNLKFYWDHKPTIESSDERKHSFPVVQKEGKLILC